MAKMSVLLALGILFVSQGCQMHKLRENGGRGLPNTAGSLCYWCWRMGDIECLCQYCNYWDCGFYGYPPRRHVPRRYNYYGPRKYNYHRRRKIFPGIHKSKISKYMY